MLPEPFALERYFARYESGARYLLSASDCEPLGQAELLALADDGLRERWERLRLGYTESQGLPDLRAAVAVGYQTVRAEQVLIATPEEAIFLLMNAVLDRGDHVVCTFPGYQSLYQLALALGCEVSYWRPVEEQEWRFDPADLARLVRPVTKLIVWNFPHNPTGALPSPGEFDAVMQIAETSRAYCFSDEMYRLLELDPTDRLPAAVDRLDRAVSLAGMSKVFGMAGVRIGWLACKDPPLLQKMMELKDYTTICSSAPSELLALIGLRTAGQIVERNRQRVARNVEVVRSFLLANEDVFTWVPPKAGTVAFPRLLNARPSLTARQAGGVAAFCTRVLAATGVLVLPSSVFGYGDNHFRLGLGRDDLRDALPLVGEYLEHGAGA